MKQLLTVTAILSGCLVTVFCDALFNEQVVLFSNDCPYGALIAEQSAMPSSTITCWTDLNWLGEQQPARNCPFQSVIAFLPVLVALLLGMLKYPRQILLSMMAINFIAIVLFCSFGLTGIIHPGFEPIWDYVPGISFFLLPWFIMFSLMYEQKI